MKIMILGLGVIGTTYGYIFQKAGFEIEHFIREEKRQNQPEMIKIKLLDGRNKKTQQVEDIYKVNKAESNSEYDLILVSVSSNKRRVSI